MRTIKRVKITTPIEQHIGIMAETQEEAEGIVKEILNYGSSKETNLTRGDVVEQLRKKGSITPYNIKVDSSTPGLLRFKDDNDYANANADWRSTDQKRERGDGQRYEEIHAIRKPEEKRYDIQIYINDTNVCDRSITLPNGVKVNAHGDTTTYIELRDVDEEFYVTVKKNLSEKNVLVSRKPQPEILKDGPVKGRTLVAWELIKKPGSDTPTMNEGIRPILPGPFDPGFLGTGIAVLRQADSTNPIFTLTGVLD